MQKMALKALAHSDDFYRRFDFDGSSFTANILKILYPVVLKIIPPFQQFVATTVKNLLIFDMSLCYAFPGIIIPALSGIQNVHNLNETLTLSPVETSWLGKMILFFIFTI